jgi:hypothetical protein
VEHCFRKVLDTFSIRHEAISKVLPKKNSFVFLYWCHQSLQILLQLWLSSKWNTVYNVRIFSWR